MLTRWRWLAAIAVAFPQCALAAVHNGTPLRFHAGIADFSIMREAPNAHQHGVRSRAHLILGIPDVIARFKGEFVAHAHQAAWQQDTGTAGKLDWDVTWQDHGVALQFGGGQDFHSNSQDNVTGEKATLDHFIKYHDMQTSRAEIVARPFQGLRLQFEAGTRDTIRRRRRWLEGKKGSRRNVKIAAGYESANVTWSPISAITLSGQAKLISVMEAAQDSEDGKITYEAVEPRLTMTLQPCAGCSVRLGFDRTVTPLDPVTLLAHKTIANRSATRRLLPNSVDAFKSSLMYKFEPNASLSITYRNEWLNNTTTLATTDIGQVPVSMTAGHQQSVSAALKFTLDALGAPHTTIMTTGVWRRSNVTDPVTGNVRGLSGEVPHEALIRLTHSWPRAHLTFGLNGQVGSEKTYYQPYAETTVARSASFGAFVRYDPGPFSLHLKFDGLAGAMTKTNKFYVGSRAIGVIDHVARMETSATTVELSFTKVLGS